MNTATKWTDTMTKQVAHCIMQGYPEVDYLDINPKRHTTRAALRGENIDRLKFYRYLIQKGEYNDEP